MVSFQKKKLGDGSLHVSIIGKIDEQFDGKKLATLEGALGPIYAVAFHASGKTFAVGGFNGVVRLHDADTGKLIKEFGPAPLKSNVAAK